MPHDLRQEHNKTLSWTIFCAAHAALKIWQPAYCERPCPLLGAKQTVTPRWIRRLSPLNGSDVNQELLTEMELHDDLLRMPCTEEITLRCMRETSLHDDLLHMTSADLPVHICWHRISLHDGSNVNQRLTVEVVVPTSPACKGFLSEMWHASYKKKRFNSVVTGQKRIFVWHTRTKQSHSWIDCRTRLALDASLSSQRSAEQKALEMRRPWILPCITQMDQGPVIIALYHHIVHDCILQRLWMVSWPVFLGKPWGHQSPSSHRFELGHHMSRSTHSQEVEFVVVSAHRGGIKAVLAVSTFDSYTIFPDPRSNPLKCSCYPKFGLDFFLHIQ